MPSQELLDSMVPEKTQKQEQLLLLFGTEACQAGNRMGHRLASCQCLAHALHGVLDDA